MAKIGTCLTENQKSHKIWKENLAKTLTGYGNKKKLLLLLKQPIDLSNVSSLEHWSQPFKE